MDYTYIIVVSVALIILLFVFIMVARFIFSVKGSNIKRLFFEKRYATLLVRLKKELKDNANNYVAHFYLAETYLALNNFVEALSHYNKVIFISKYDDDISEILVRERLVDIYLKLDKLKEAEKELFLILEQSPNNYLYNYRVGDILYLRNYREAAASYFLKALEINSNHADSLFRIGQVCYEVNKKTEAFNYMKKCLDINSDCIEANYYIGLVYVDSSSYFHAMKEFDKSIKSKDYRLKSIYQKGKCHFLLGDLDASILELEKGIFYLDDKDALSLGFRYLLARAYEAKRELPMAITQWDIISSIRQNYKDVEEKLEEYKDIRLDDNIKDFMTATHNSFDELCKKMVSALELDVIEYKSRDGVGEVIAIEGESKWRSQRRNKLCVKIYRSSDDITSTVIRDLVDSMKVVGAYKGVIITSGTFSRSAIDYASSRPIDLYDKWKLSELLASCK